MTQLSQLPHRCNKEIAVSSRQLLRPVGIVGVQHANHVPARSTEDLNDFRKGTEKTPKFQVSVLCERQIRKQNRAIEGAGQFEFVVRKSLPQSLLDKVCERSSK